MADLTPPRLTHAKTLTRSRDLRRNATEAERRLWSELRARQLLGWKFRRQFPIGDYIVDFCCIKGRLVVELDGEQHAERQQRYDVQRTKEIEKRGFNVIRFWNHQVLENLEGVADKIIRQLEEAGGKSQ